MIEMMQWCADHPTWGIFFTLCLTMLAVLGTRTVKIIMLGRDVEAEQQLIESRARNADKLIALEREEMLTARAKADMFQRMAEAADNIESLPDEGPEETE